ncbi:hypothetical protein EDB89DRAFT_549275 [Lactarius sanguifluus]|nr:hypothetical protein EDB89DRAFT_549275 [Lactarius sanguifluus]
MLSQGVTLGTGSLKIALNTFSLWKSPTPPSRVGLQLPVEILQKIFLLLAEPYASEGGNPPARPHWIAITHVCRYWRSAALGLHELWSSITPGLSISLVAGHDGALCPAPRPDRHPPQLPHVLTASTRSPPQSCFSLHPGYAPSASSASARTSSASSTAFRSPSPLESLDLCVIDSGQAVDLPEALFGGKAPHLPPPHVRM